MIQANELRIGNYIMDRSGKIWQIDSWESKYKVAAKPPLLEPHPIWGQMYGHPLTEDVEYLQPIPLTAEILEKCGFKKMPFGYEKNGFKINNTYGFSYHPKDGNSIRITSLHQLQNLFFALTGEELEIGLS